MMKCTKWLILNNSHRDIHDTGEGTHEHCVKEGEEVPLWKNGSQVFQQQLTK